VMPDTSQVATAKAPAVASRRRIVLMVRWSHASWAGPLRTRVGCGDIRGRSGSDWGHARASGGQGMSKPQNVAHGMKTRPVRSCPAT
jgi:hypothetical protein